MFSCIFAPPKTESPSALAQTTEYKTTQLTNTTMKKFALILVALLSSINAFAFKFDGIDLNGTVMDVTRAIAKKNYVATVENPNVLTGLCQGTKINLSFNLNDVTEKNHVGQLFVEVPNADATAFVDNAQLLNVIYHLVSNTEAGYLYSVDEDGTTLLLSKTETGIRLNYSTPYYKAK